MKVNLWGASVVKGAGNTAKPSYRAFSKMKRYYRKKDVRAQEPDDELMQALDDERSGLDE